MNRREMLLENFKFIFSFLVRTCSASELEKALGYVQVSQCSIHLGTYNWVQGNKCGMQCNSVANRRME